MKDIGVGCLCTCCLIIGCLIGLLVDDGIHKHELYMAGVKEIKHHVTEVDGEVTTNWYEVIYLDNKQCGAR